MTVFVVQKQTKFNPETGEEELRYDLSHLRKYGSYSFLLGNLANPFRPEQVIKDLTERLAEFSEADYIVPIGSPILVGIAMSIAANKTKGCLRLLQWSTRYSEYTEITTRVF